MYEPPPGYEDMLDDAAEVIREPGPFRDLHVDGVGVIQARRPLPNSAPNLAMSANSKIPDTEKVGHLNLFVRNHLGDEQYEQILYRMMVGELPDDTIERIVRAITTRGTPRPTMPSSHCV